MRIEQAIKVAQEALKIVVYQNTLINTDKPTITAILKIANRETAEQAADTLRSLADDVAALRVAVEALAARVVTEVYDYDALLENDADIDDQQPVEWWCYCCHCRGKTRNFEHAADCEVQLAREALARLERE